MSLSTTSTECLQGWWLHWYPGKPTPMPHHSLHKEILLNVHPKPPLVQSETTSSPPTALYVREETDTLITAVYLQEVSESSGSCRVYNTAQCTPWPRTVLHALSDPPAPSSQHCHSPSPYTPIPAPLQLCQLTQPADSPPSLLSLLLVDHLFTTYFLFFFPVLQPVTCLKLKHVLKYSARTSSGSGFS